MCVMMLCTSVLYDTAFRALNRTDLQIVVGDLNALPHKCLMTQFNALLHIYAVLSWRSARR